MLNVIDFGMDAQQAVSAPRSRRPARFCIPQGVHLKQMAAIFVKNASHPEWHHMSAAQGLVHALGEVFPCGARQ